MIGSEIKNSEMLRNDSPHSSSSSLLSSHTHDFLPSPDFHLPLVKSYRSSHGTHGPFGSKGSKAGLEVALWADKFEREILLPLTLAMKINAVVNVVSTVVV